jgi:hypothetical protein
MKLSNHFHRVFRRICVATSLLRQDYQIENIYGQLINSNNETPRMLKLKMSTYSEKV